MEKIQALFSKCYKIVTWCLENAHTAEVSDVCSLINQPSDGISLIAIHDLISTSVPQEKLPRYSQICATLMLGLIKAMQCTQTKNHCQQCNLSGAAAVQSRPVATSLRSMLCLGAIVLLLSLQTLDPQLCLSCALFTLGTGGIMLHLPLMAF